MATTTESTVGRPWSADIDFLRCPSCQSSLHEVEEGLACEGCGTSYPVRDGLLIIKEQPTADNKIAADFYNSKLWPKFRFWERFFWACIGGEKRSRQQVLKHLPTEPGLKLLDIAIGDGVYTSWLPGSWSITGLDVSTAQLAACQKRNGDRDLRLILGEAEIAAVPRPSIRRRPLDRRFQPFQRPREGSPRNGPCRQTRRDGRRFRRAARTSPTGCRPPHRLPRNRPLGRLQTHEPRRRLHRPGRTSPRYRHRRDRPQRPGEQPYEVIWAKGAM